MTNEGSRERHFFSGKQASDAGLAGRTARAQGPGGPLMGKELQSLGSLSTCFVHARGTVSVTGGPAAARPS